MIDERELTDDDFDRPWSGPQRREVRVRRTAPLPDRLHRRRLTALVAAAIVLTLAGVGLAIVLREDSSATIATTDAAAGPAAAVSAPTGEEVAVPAGAAAPAQVAAPTVPVDNAIAATDEPNACRLTSKTMGIGKSGPDVECLQVALRDAGYFTGTVNALYDNDTADAVQRLQQDRGLFVDGVAGRETGKSLGIWPDEASLVVRTPPPPEGAEDLAGFELSPVAVSGDDPSLPPLPADSGSGRRVVYDRLSQRVWAVGEDDQVIRSWLVSGSQYENEVPGTHEVFSRSETSTAWNGKAILPLMIRWYPTDRGNLGFHGIPIHVEDGSPYQTTDELGTRLSGGCQRQHDTDAAFMWSFATVGTTVVVT